MAERIAYLERLLWGGKRDKRVAQGPTLFDAFFNEADESKEAAIASTVREIQKEAEKRRAGSGKKPVRPGQSCRHGYAWQFQDARPQSHGTYVYLKGSRAEEIPRAQLRHFKGAVLTDGYKVYDYFESVPGVISLSCMAQSGASSSKPKGATPNLPRKHWNTSTHYICWKKTSEAAGLPRRKSVCKKRAKALPIMDAMDTWMESVQRKCTPDDLLGRALEYAYKLWPRARRYADDGRYQLDNNPVERGQRPTVMGRKNYLSSKTNEGAVDNAVIYSLLGSCEITNVNPLKWMEHALDNLYPGISEDELTKLLPCNFI